MSWIKARGFQISPKFKWALYTAIVILFLAAAYFIYMEEHGCSLWYPSAIGACGHDEQLKQDPVHYDLIILRKKHLEMLEKAMPLTHYKIAAIEPVGSKKFVLLKFKH